MTKTGNINKIINKKTIFALLTIVFFFAVFLLNSIYPLYVDDWVYSFIYKDYHMNYDETVKPIGGLYDIVVSQYNHYLGWGGRSVVHAIAQFLLYINPVCRTILNALVYILFVWLIYRICNGCDKKNIRPYLYIGVFLLLFIFLPAFNHTILWITGNANYLWGTFILLSFIFFYYRYYITGSTQDSTGFSAFILLFGIVAGWTNENSVASVLFMFIYLIYLKKTKKHIPRWVILGAVGLCIGAALLILAPGNFVRAEVESSTADLSVLQIVKSRIKNFIVIYKTVYGIPVLSIVFVCLLMFRFRKKSELLASKEATMALVFFLMAHLSVGIMLFVPYFPARATFFGVSLLVISVGILWKDLSAPNIKIINALALSAIFIFSVSKYTFRYKYISIFNNAMKERVIFIDEEKKKGNFDIILDKRIHLPSEFNFYDASPDTSNWVNKTYLNYFGIKSVRLID